MEQLNNKKCPICKITLAKDYKGEDATKHKNNGYSICKPQNICGFCNFYEVKARLGVQFVFFHGIQGWSFTQPKNWYAISATRRKNVSNWCQLIADEMLQGKTYDDALNEIRENGHNHMRGL